ncbi:MAG: O-antigen ligase family protein [Polaribacter sp.]|uniref:O-antigen ligase family protein n=1 Tax=Polaribacter sp. TaxID=1920175 RepID=UPI00326784C1
MKVIERKKIGILEVIIAVLFLLILVPSVLKSILLALASLSIITYSILKKNKINYKFILTSTFFFLYIIVTLFYSENVNFGVAKLFTMASLFVMPFVFSFLSKKNITSIFKFEKLYLWIFIFGVSLFNLIPFLWYLITQDTISEMIRNYPRSIMIDYGKYSIHPIYLSMHICIGIIFAIKLFIDEKLKFNKFVLVILTILLAFFLIILAKKGPMIALLIALTIWSFIKSKNYFKNFLVILLSISFLVVLPKTKNKFKELLTLKKIEKGTVTTSSNIRFTLLFDGFELFKESPIFGYGIGDYNDELKNKSESRDKFFIGKNYNTHNQYLSFLLIGGLPLICLFLYFYYTKIANALLMNNYLLLTVIVFYGVAMLFENILERENGVIFFAFFIIFFSLKKAQE